jgi:hypothetical protein
VGNRRNGYETWKIKDDIYRKAAVENSINSIWGRKFQLKIITARKKRRRGRQVFIFDIPLKGAVVFVQQRVNSGKLRFGGDAAYQCIADVDAVVNGIV